MQLSIYWLYLKYHPYFIVIQDHKFWTYRSAQKENLKFEAILQPSVWMAQRSLFLILILGTIWSFIALRVVVGQTVLFKNGLFTPSLAAAGFKT